MICFTPASEGVDVIGGWCLGWLVEGLEGEEFVAVGLVLFAAQGDLGGQAALEVVDQGIKSVENGDDLFLDFEWRNREYIFQSHFFTSPGHSSSSHEVH